MRSEKSRSTGYQNTLLSVHYSALRVSQYPSRLFRGLARVHGW